MSESGPGGISPGLFRWCAHHGHGRLSPWKFISLATILDERFRIGETRPAMGFGARPQAKGETKPEGRGRGGRPSPVQDRSRSRGLIFAVKASRG